MRDEVTKEVITKITNNIADTLLIGINENKEELPYTIAVINFILELREKGIVVDFYKTFDSLFIDVINSEINNYLVK